MISLSTFLASTSLLFCQQLSVDDVVSATSLATPSEALAIANELGPNLSPAELVAAGKLILNSSGTTMLALGQLQSFADEPLHIEDLVSLLNTELDPITNATLRVFAERAFYEADQPSTALFQWLSQIDASSHPEVWCEAQMTLALNAPSTMRRTALRQLRANCDSESKLLAKKSILALARTNSPLSAVEVEMLSQIGDELTADAQLAQSLLNSVEIEKRFRSKVDALQKLYDSQPGAYSGANDDLDVIQELLIRAQNQHMEGENFSRQELIGAAADGLLRKLDPHSTFFSGEEYSEFIFDMKQEYGGIGAYVNTIDGVFTITRPIYSGPAYAAGLLSEDRIISVDGWDTIDQPNAEIIKRLKGPPGTIVELEVVRRGWSEPKIIGVERKRIQVPVVQSDILPGNIVYIELLSFSEDVAQKLFEVISAAQRVAPINGVVLDMRNNPGGYLNEAVSICDLFLPKGKLVVSTKSRVGSDKLYKTRARAIIEEDVPLTILVNKYSASASEIVAGALSIHGRATTVGEKTFGKGSVQNVFPMSTSRDEEFTDSKNDGYRNGIYDTWETFDDSNSNGKYDYGDRVKLTIAYYYLPDGSTIHTQRDHEGKIVEQGGVSPDIESAFDEVPYIEAREVSHLIEQNLLQDYAKQLFEEHKDVAVQLAINDLHDTASYPGWDDFYQSLNTDLESHAIRRWVRRYLRTQVSDARGEVFPGNGFFGDYVEDPVLRTAIKHMLSGSSVEFADLPEYADLIAAMSPQ
ncbi:MAG: S41 family peptidase [Planctomycetota bacterium]|nr:S41 family peptidase [Planctomycetota bacterium]